MNHTRLRLSLLSLAITLTSLGANASVKYLLTITNGGMMPISPTAIYVRTGQGPIVQIGDEPTEGFVQLCQTGNPSLRLMELKEKPEVTFVTQTQGLIFPGQSKTIEVEVHKPLVQSVSFETMYGKTKDICATGSIGSHSLYALKQHITSEVSGRDNALASGAFLAPLLPTSNSRACGTAADGVSCIRELAQPNTGKKSVHFFAPYLPSLLTFLETKFGAEDVQSLVIPSAGAVQFKLVLKH